MDRRSRSILSRDECSGHLRRGRCPSSLRQRRHFGGRRRGYGRQTGSSVPRPFITMNARELQEVRSTPLFAALTDEQLSCLEGGEVMEAPVGTLLASEGERTGF